MLFRKLCHVILPPLKAVAMMPYFKYNLEQKLFPWRPGKGKRVNLQAQMKPPNMKLYCVLFATPLPQPPFMVAHQCRVSNILLTKKS